MSLTTACENTQRVGAVVVSHNPPGTLVGNLLAICRELPVVILIDDYSQPEQWANFRSALDTACPAPIETLAEPEAGVWRAQLSSDRELRLIRQQGNVGIAAAYSRGMQEMARTGCTHILLLDHDSDLPEQDTRQLLAAMGDAPADALGVVPCLRHPYQHMRCRWPQAIEGSSWRFRFVYAADIRQLTPVDVAISSGMLLDLRKLEAIGGFRNDLFIDLVDTELCLRARSHGLRLYAVPGVWMPHSIGKPRERGTRALKLYPTHHAPFRHYYLARNRIHLYKEYAARFPFWAVYETLGAMKLIVKVCLFERHRRAKLLAMLRGTRDGLMGRLGPAPNA